LIDVDGSDSLEDEELIPLLKAAGLNETNARAAARRLLGDQITVRALRGVQPSRV
jgi:DNA repair protein RadC